MSSPMRLSDVDSPGRTPRRQTQSTRSPVFGTPRKYLCKGYFISILLHFIILYTFTCFIILNLRSLYLYFVNFWAKGNAAHTGVDNVETPLRWGTTGTRQNTLDSGNRAATILASSERESGADSGDHFTDHLEQINGSESGLQLSSPINYGTPSSLGSIRTPRSGIRGTPIRHRPDINTDKRLRQFTLQEPVSLR